MLDTKQLKRLNLLLALLVLISSFSVIYSKHKTRLLYASFQACQAQVDELHIEWSQLLLEQGAWSTNSRVERVASEHLQMELPSLDKIVVLKHDHP